MGEELEIYKEGDLGDLEETEWENELEIVTDWNSMEFDFSICFDFPNLERWSRLGDFWGVKMEMEQQHMKVLM